jgi:hypothetical protein
MRLLPLALIASSFAAASAYAADREFTEVVHCISDEFHTRPTSIPFFGLVNVFAAAVHPAGAKHIDLAIFEHLDDRDRQGHNLPDAILRAVGRSWQPFVQVRSRREGHQETVFVFMRQDGKNWKLLVAAVEREEATVMQLLLNPDALARWLSDPESSARHWHGETD